MADFLINVINKACDHPALTLFEGEEATLEVKLTNNTGDSIPIATGNTIKITPPRLIDIESLSQVDVTGSWELVPIDSTRKWFKIIATGDGNWLKDTDITFTLKGVRNKRNVNAGAKGQMLFYSEDVFDSEEYASRQLSLNNRPSNFQSNQQDVLNMASDFLLSVLNKASDDPFLTIYVGEEATLEVKLTNKTGGSVSVNTGNTIKFTPPGFIDIGNLKLMNLSGSWKLDPIDHTRDWFKISATGDGNWQKDTDMTFTLIGVQNKSNENAGVNGAMTCYSDSVFDEEEFSSQQLSLNNPHSNVKPNLKDVLNVTLNNGGVIFVGDSLANQLTLNLKNLRDDGKALFDGANWPKDDQDKVANPRIKVFFDYGTAGGALTDKITAQSIGVNQMDTEYEWECSDPINSSSGPLWQLIPQHTEIIGSGNFLNASFLFSDIVALNTGATQMYVQCIGFPCDDNTYYNDHTFIVPIKKTYSPVKSIIYFNPLDANLVMHPGEPLTADLYWQVFDIQKVRLTALGYPSLVVEEFQYDDVLSSDNFSVDLSEFYADKSITFSLIDQNDNKIGKQTAVFIDLPAIEVERFELIPIDAKNPRIEIIITPLQLIHESDGAPYVTLIMDGGRTIFLPNKGNDSAKFIYEGNYKDLFNEELKLDKDYQFQLNVSPTFGHFNPKFYTYDPIEIGDFLFGGIVFWIDPKDNTHGLVCAIADQTYDQPIQWSNGKDVDTGARGKAIGTGKSNTDKIIKVQGSIETDYAAGLARAYRGGGFTDWFLPSFDELLCIYYSRDIIDVAAKANGGHEFIKYPDYTCSSEASYNALWYVDIFSGFTEPWGKSESNFRVRAVRAY